jgi:hypothetical protein
MTRSCAGKLGLLPRVTKPRPDPPTAVVRVACAPIIER